MLLSQPNFMTSHVMERHYVFMLIFEFFYLSGNFYISGRLIMSKSRIRVCRQIKLTSTHKVTNQFLRFTHIWNKQVMEHKAMKRKFRICEKI